MEEEDNRPSPWILSNERVTAIKALLPGAEYMLNQALASLNALRSSLGWHDLMLVSGAAPKRGRKPKAAAEEDTFEAAAKPVKKQGGSRWKTMSPEGQEAIRKGIKKRWAEARSHGYTSIADYFKDKKAGKVKKNLPPVKAGTRAKKTAKKAPGKKKPGGSDYFSVNGRANLERAGKTLWKKIRAAGYNNMREYSAAVRAGLVPHTQKLKPLKSQEYKAA